jgi:hypothetical protein
LNSVGVKRLIERALWAQSLRTKLRSGKKRHEFQTDHGFRKWFKTQCEIGGMKPINIEVFMGHSVGISDSYYRATEKELLEDYLKAINYLTISNEHSLQREISIVVEQSENNYNLLKSELYTKEKEINFLKESDRKKDEELATIKDQVQIIMSSLGIVGDKNKTKIAKNLIQKGVFISRPTHHCL